MITWYSQFTGKLHESFELRLAEFGSATTMTLWAVTLVYYPGLLDTWAYRFLGNMMPQEYWITLLGIVGFGRLAILLVNGAISKSPHLRSLASFLSGAIWIQIAIAFWQADVTPTAYAVYAVAAGTDYFSLIRASREARRLDVKNAGRNNGLG